MDTVWIAAAAILVILSVVWSWWALEDGAYFGVVMYPGLLVLYAGLLLLLRSAPWRGDFGLSRPAVLALGGILALAVWAGLSALWSPAADIAIADAQRIAGYGLSFGLGLWLCNLLGSRMHLALAPLTIAAGVAGLVTVGAMIAGDEIKVYLEVDGTLQFPLGYRNANAAFFAIALWPALALARSPGLALGWRAGGLGIATLCVELALLSQSRGSVIAIAAALIVYLLLVGERARGLVWLLLAVLPALVVLPALGDLFTVANETGRIDAVVELRAAGRAAIAGFVLAGLIGGIAARVESRSRVRPETEARADRLVTRGLLAGLVAAALGFVIATGNPVDWVSDRVEEFRTEGSPSFQGESTRFSVNAGTQRADLWRAALEDAGADPLLGDGGGGYQYSYLRARTNPDQNARDAHSVELEILSELGLPGLALFAVAIAGATTGALRARRLGPGAALVSGAALTAATYWLVHSSLDWFWAYPAVTAPVFGLLGAACAPCLLAPRTRRRTGRRYIALATVLAALGTVPFFLSERYTNDAFLHWREGPSRAFADLDRAADLNPLAEEPFMAAGAIALELEDRERALAAFNEAAERRPDEWAAHYFLAQIHSAGRDLDLAMRELDLAKELNPLSDRIEALEAKLRAEEAKGTK